MSFAKKIRVAILRGGPSSEYDVSLKTGEAVLRNLDKEKYEPVDLLIDKEGVWHLHGMPKLPSDALKHIDVAFVAMHGQYGEDGKLQRLLEQLGIPYTGSGPFESAIAMNKHTTKEALRRSHRMQEARTGSQPVARPFKTPVHKLFTRDDLAEKSAHIIFREVPVPAVVKPVSAGSSIGVSLVRTYPELEEALIKALGHSDQVMVEELIEGREATCGVVDGFRGEQHYALLPIEIIPHEHSQFFDYAAKYGGTSQETVSGSFSEETKRLIREAAQAVHRELGLRHYSRSDFIVHPKRGVYFLEVNTLPGLTSESLMPKSVEAIGSSMSEFLDHVITLALRGK